MIALTFEELEQQVEQLSPQQQLQLLARLSENLSTFSFTKENTEKRPDHKSATPVDSVQFDAWVAECERVADLWEGTFDSAADLRRIRDEE